MITQKRQRASTANRSSLLKNFFVKMLILCLFITSILTFHTYYTTKSEKNVIYEEWEVKAGESIWCIAGIFTPVNEDKRKLVYEIQRINGIENSHIEPGDILLIPVEVSE